jgi:hypothetical protein
MPHVVFVSPDIMFASQLIGAAATLGLKLAVAANPSDVAAKLDTQTKLVIVDLSAAAGQFPAVIAATRQGATGAKIVAFGPHVDEALLGSAQQAGCDLVLSRGQFHRQYADLLKQVATAS